MLKEIKTGLGGTCCNVRYDGRLDFILPSKPPSGHRYDDDDAKWHWHTDSLSLFEDLKHRMSIMNAMFRQREVASRGIHYNDSAIQILTLNLGSDATWLTT